MKFDFSNENFFDNHTHLINLDACEVTKEQFLKCFHHGPKYTLNENGAPIPSKRAYQNLETQGVILSLVKELSEYYGCEADLDAVIAERNKRVRGMSNLKEYVQALYDDQHIVGSVLEAGEPMGDPKTQCIPNKIVRLFRYEDILFPLIKSEPNYGSALNKLKEAVINAHNEGFMGLKGHIIRRFNYDIKEISYEQAEKSFPLAQENDYFALRDVYCAMFCELLTLCGELNMAVHIHTGTTGMASITNINTLDPTLLAPLLQKGKYEKTNIVLLHCAYPFVEKAAIMAFNYPNVYIDTSWTLPWTSIGYAETLRTLLSIAPHSHLMLGSGQHDGCEIAWLAARVSKKALAAVMEKLCEEGVINEKQAQKSAEMVLWRNAYTLYNLK